MVEIVVLFLFLFGVEVFVVGVGDEGEEIDD